MEFVFFSIALNESKIKLNVKLNVSFYEESGREKERRDMNDVQ